MRLVCSTDIEISDGTFGGFVLAVSYSLYYPFLRMAASFTLCIICVARTAMTKYCDVR